MVLYLGTAPEPLTEQDSRSTVISTHPKTKDHKVFYIVVRHVGGQMFAYMNGWLVTFIRRCTPWLVAGPLHRGSTVVDS